MAIRTRTRSAELSLVLTTILAMPCAVAAQGVTEGGELAEVVRVTPIQGHARAFEEGVKSHMAVAGELGNPSTWLVWEVITGDMTGTYVVGTFGHAWADFDQMPDDPARAEESFRTNIEPHVARAQVGFWRVRPELGMGEPGGMPPRFSQIYQITPKYTEMETFEQAFRDVVAAAGAASWAGPGWQVFQLVNGGQLPQYVMAIPGESFADFEEPSPRMDEMLIAQMGQDEAMALFERYLGSVAAENSEMLAFRQDLSYIPGGM